jgi:hypothetical protein
MIKGILQTSLILPCAIVSMSETSNGDLQISADYQDYNLPCQERGLTKGISDEIIMPGSIWLNSNAMRCQSATHSLKYSTASREQRRKKVR